MTTTTLERPYIPLSELRNMYQWSKANYYTHGEYISVRATFPHYVEEEVARLTIEALRQRVAELEAALQWALDGGGWRLLYYAHDIPAIIDTTNIYSAKVRGANEAPSLPAL
jgi:hypothetical protein